MCFCRNEVMAAPSAWVLDWGPLRAEFSTDQHWRYSVRNKSICLSIYLFIIYLSIFLSIFCLPWYAAAWCGISIPRQGDRTQATVMKVPVLTTKLPESSPFVVWRSEGHLSSQYNFAYHSAYLGQTASKPAISSVWRIKGYTQDGLKLTTEFFCHFP